MSMSPPPPRPPVPPSPPRTGSHILTLALLLLALIVAVSVVTVWIGLRFLGRGISVNVQERDSGRNVVSIKTPVGNLQVNKGAEISEAQLGLPIYPGAQREREDSAAVNMEFPAQQGVRLSAARFETSDSLEKVERFYRDHIGTEVTKLTPGDRGGRTVLEIKRGGQERIVALERRGTGTRIELIRVNHGPAEAN